MVNVMNKNTRSDMPEKTGELLVCKSCLSFTSKTESPKRRWIGRKDLYWKCQSWCLLHSNSLSSEIAAPEEDLGSILPPRPWTREKHLPQGQPCSTASESLYGQADSMSPPPRNWSKAILKEPKIKIRNGKLYEADLGL